jgi:tetratricopeptide (TPR) repeat protein
MRKGIFFLIAVALVFLLAWVLGALRQTALTEIAVRPEASDETLEARSANAFARILGEARATTADFLWAKTEVYMHEGVLYVPHLNQAAIVRGEDDHDEEHHFEELLIRSREQDFRGLIGYLERQVKPYQDPGASHAHSPGTELLPWYRMMILADPSNLRSYMGAAVWLRHEEEFEKALEVLDEGIERNPHHPLIFQLYLSRTGIFSRIRDFESGLESALEGLRLALPVRPPGGEEGARIQRGLRWTEEAEEDFRFLFRYRALLLIELGRDEEALQAAREMVEIVPDDGPIRRILGRLQKTDS